MLSGSVKLIGGLNQLQHQKNYIHHLKRMIQIETQQQRMRKVQHEQTKIADILRKSKEASKSFKKIEDLNKRKDEDRKMVDVLIDIKSRSRLNTQWGRSYSHQNLKPLKSKVKGSDSQAISNQKRTLLMKINQNSVHVRRHRKKLKIEIDSYLKKKNLIPKINRSQSHLHAKQQQKYQRPVERSIQHQNGINSSRIVITLPD